ncbi:hypothetical protein ACFU93_32375 [Streptomyces sp. NPDC057611]|uniref:hypothetical protein n=1 Tax=Streptomyces sp. NPDC057611 TaxID=3346182 RepID=UPI00367DB6BE
MGAIRRFVQSLDGRNDRELARTQYAGQKSASQEAAEARRTRHRKAVDKLAAKTRKDASRDIAADDVPLTGPARAVRCPGPEHDRDGL